MPENPVYNPSKIVGKKTIDSSVVPAYNPNKIISKGVLENPDGIAKGFDPGVIVEDAKNKEIDNAIDFIDKQAVDSGRIALSEERKGVLKDVLKNPNATKEQKEQAILTVQGYDKDTSGDVSNKFYMQQDNNGVYVPKLLKSGQRPPKGTAINSFHGTQADANNDTWYTDLTKSLANGLVGAAGGLVDLAQAGQQLVTGEESEILNDARNSVDFFKFKKDEDLNKSIYNTEGITKWADLLDKDRLDLSPSALWGTFNGLAESLSEFGFGTMTGGSLIKGAKAAKYGLQGIEKAVELGSAAQKGAILFGSTVAQLGDVMEAGKEAGLKGRDLPAFVLATATAMGTIDAMTGLEGKVMSDLFKKSKAQILKNAIKTVERDAAGNITPQAFKELAKRTSIQYGEMARNASKEIVKDAIGEGTQEAVQDFTQKAAENLWDKMTPDERGQFGTDALSAKSFGSYLNSFATGAWTGIPMALQQQAFKKRNEEQSIHVYDRVKQGEDGVKALRIDLNEALANNDISQSEYEQANFKIDAYQKYHDETRDVNLKPEDERKAFELSFQIQGIKTEIPTNENEISKLDPISRAKVESKQKQAKELQNELNEIILKGEIKAEPVIASKIEEKVAKENDKIATENAKVIGENAKAAEKVIKNTGNKWQDLIDNSVSEKELDAVIDQMDKSGETTPDLVDYVGMKRTEFNKPKKETVKPTAKVDLEEGDGTTEIKVGKEYVKEPKLPKQPELKDETRTYDTIDNETFNHTKFPSRTKFQMVVDKLSKWQNKEMSGVIKKKSYKYLDPKTKEWTPNSVLEVELEDGKRIRFASSMYYDSKDETGFRSHTRNERLLGNEEGVPVGLKLIDINNPKGLLEEGKYTPGKKVLKIYNKRTGQFLSWAKETHRGKADSKRADGSLVTTKEEGDLLKTLEQQEYNENIKGNEGDIARIITPKPKPTPTQRAEEATNKIVEEAKSARLTNQVSKMETADKEVSEKESLVPKSTTDFEVKEVMDYNTVEKNKYKPNQQLKFNQGTFEPVRIVADEDLIELISIGSQINNDLKGNKKKTYSLDRKKELEDKFGISAVFAHSKAKLLAKENRSSSQEKIIILGDKTIKEDVKKEPVKEIKVEEKAAPKPIEEKKEIKPALIEISNSQKQSLLDNGYTEKEINDAISEANRLVNLPVNELLKELNDKKMFVSTGNTNVWRVDTRGLTTKDVSNAINHILKGTGEDVKYVQTFISEVLNDIKKYGNVSGIIGTGGMTQKSNIPLYEFLLEKELNPGITSEIPLTDEEINDYLAYESEIKNQEKGLVKLGKQKFYTEDELRKNEEDINKEADSIKAEYDKRKKEGAGEDELNKLQLKELKKREEVDKLQIKNNNLLYDIVDNSISSINEINNELKYKLLEKYFIISRRDENGFIIYNPADSRMSSIFKKELDVDNLSRFLSKNEIKDSENIAKKLSDEILNKISKAYDFEQFQKVSQRKGDITKVVAAIKKALPKINVVENATQFKGEQSNISGKVSADGKFIYINPNYAGLDTPIHEAGHILIDAMGYNNKVIQSAIKQLRNTPLYAETKERYPELSEQELDKEVLAEAIGREGADIFGKVEDRSKFKAYLDYIFDWLKQKLGMDKNIAKSVAKQIIGGIKTKDLKGVAIGKEQLQKADKEKKKPFAAQALKYNQYAMEEGFDAQKEFDKYEQASVMLKEAKLEEKLAEEAADEAVTDEEIKAADAELEDKRALLKEASKEFSIKAKKYLGYLKYKKDFKSVQAILEDKDLEDYTYDELNDLIVKLFSFNDRAAKSVKERAYQKLGHMAGTKQHEIHKGKEGVIEALTRTSDISPLKAKILHVSHFSENNPDMQALALASGKAIIDKLSEANSLKDTHAKLGLKVIQEENKRLGITGMAANRFSSDSSKYFEWMINEDGNYLTIDEAKAKGLSKAKLDYLDFHRETVAGYRESMSANDYENVKMGAIRVDKNFREAYKSEGLLPAFSYYLGGGATNLGRVRILHNGKVMSYSEIEKEIINSVDKKSVKSIAKALYDLLVANIKARYQLKKGENIDEKDNPLELKGDAEYSLNEKGQLVSKFDKPRAKDRGYSKDFYKAMNQFIDESAHVKHISKIMPLVEAVEYLNKHGYMEEGYIPKKNVSKWINDWKALHIFKEPHVNDPIIDAAVKSMRKLVASTTMWFNPVANTINVFIGNYNNWRAENAEILARGNARLFGGKGSRKEIGVVNDYALGIIRKYNLVNQDFDSHPVIKAGSIFSKLATFGTQVGEYQIQGSLGLGLLSQEEFDSFEFTEDKYGNKVLTVKKGVDEDKLKAKMTQVKNRVTDIQGKYPDEDRRNIMRGEFGKALFQFKVWMPDWFKERFSAKYINAYRQEKEGSYTKMLRVGVKEMYNDLKKGDIKKALNNPSFKTNLKGMITIGALLALKHSDDDDDEKKKGGLNWDNALSQVLFIFDLEQDKYMVSNPAAVLGKIKDFINAFEALIRFEEDAWQKTKRIIPANKAITFVENQMK